MAQHQVDCIQLLKKRKCKEDDTGSKFKEFKNAETTEGLASFDWACMLFSVVELLTKSSFKQYLVEGEIPLDELPHCLVLTLDWLQTQWRVVWCLRHYFKCNVEAVPDITHRRMNDLNLATDAAGWSFTKQRGFIVANIHFGPWNGGGYHKDIQEVCLDLSQNEDPNSPLLLYFWPRIIVDLRLPLEEQGLEGRKHFLAGLPNMKFCRTKNEKASHCKWDSLQKAWMSGQDEYCGPFCYAVTVLAKKKKWINTLEDLTSEDQAVDPVLWQPLEEEAAPIPKGKGKGKHKGKAKAKAKAAVAPTKQRAIAKSEVQRDRAKCANTLHFVLKTVFNLDFVYDMRKRYTYI